LVSVALRGQPGLVYHVGTGESHSVGQGLELLLRLSGRSAKLCVDPRRMARRGPADSRARIDRIRDHTGWTPSISFEQSLSNLWEHAQASRAEQGGRADTWLPLTA
jgi:GDP-4-dehydro-6-deoxy-D-mannose reductase